MTFSRFRPAARLLVVASAGFAGLPASAQPQPQGEAMSASVPSRPRDCGAQAALYQGAGPKGVKLWVLRRGTMVLADNPLRPGARDEAVVLEVVVNGRRASAMGPDTDNLRQSGAIQAVEREGAEAIRWASTGDAAPTLRVVGEDGRVLLGPLPFGGCEDAPAAKAVAMPKERKPAPEKRGAKAGAPAALPGSHLPQGALDGLALPKPGR